MIPLIQIAPVRRKGKPNQINGGTVTGWMTDLAGAVGDRPFLLDVVRRGPSTPVQLSSRKVPLLARVHEQARKRGLRFVPVLGVSDVSARPVAMVAAAVSEDGRGCALRVELDAVIASGDEQVARLVALTEAVGAPVECTDVILDLGYMDPDAEYEVDDIKQAVDEVAGAGAWRSLVLVGSSMPRSLGGGLVPEGSITGLPRKEWALWRELADAAPIRLPAFGDYAIQNPLPPAEPQKGSSMRRNIRYTVRDETLVARAVGAYHESDNQQYRELCERLIERDEFEGPTYTWGDRCIRDCAKGHLDPGDQNLWRGLGTSHHLRVVVDQLKQLKA
jgi:hypothetical protein